MSSIGRAMSWTMLQHVVRLGVGVVTALGLARHLGPAEFGLYQSLMAWLLIFVAVSGGGLQSLVIQRLAVSENPAQVLGTVFRMRALWTLGAMAFCMGIPLVEHWDHAELIGCAFLLPVLFLQMGDLVDYWFQSQLKPRLVVITRTSASLVSLGVMGFGLWMSKGIYFFLGAFVLEQFLGTMVLYWINHRKGISALRWNYDSALAQELFRDAWPMLLATVCLLLYTRIDLVMLKHLSSPEQTGFFAASTRLSQLWIFLPMVVVNGAFPMLARTRKNDPQHYEQQSRDLFAILGALGLPLALVLSLGATWITSLLFGKAFSPTAPMLALQGWITLCYFLRTGLDRFLITEKATKFNLLVHACTAALNIVLNLLWIPSMGGTGAALASFVAMGFGIWIVPWLTPTTRIAAKHVAFGTFGLAYLATRKGRKSCWALLGSGIP